MTAKSEIEKLIDDAPDDVKEAIAAIFRIEKGHAYQANPIGVKDEVKEAINEVVE